MGKQARLELLIGVSASGKSTYSHKEWEKDPKNVVLVSRDNIRKLLHGYSDENVFNYYNRKDIMGREKTVTEYLNELIRFSLSKGKRVIVDNTHLKVSYIELYQKFNVPTDLTVFHTDLNLCLERDAARVKSVGADVIKKQSRQFKTLINELKLNEAIGVDNPIITTKNYKFISPRFQYEPTLEFPEAIIVDVDGTIADNLGLRSPYEMDKVFNDAPKLEIIEVVKSMKDRGFQVIICTGRDGEGEGETKRWLEYHDIPFDGFYIRKAGDMRPDFVVKEEMWREIVKEYNITLMIDDRRQVIDHARSLGFTVLDVANHTF